MAQLRVLPSVAYLQACFTYDPKTGILTWRERPREHFNSERGWRIFNSKRAGKAAGTMHDRGYCMIVIGNHRYYAQRIIWKMMTGEEPSKTIDHHNGITKDNRWDNLRPATQMEQTWNSAPRKNTDSDHRGVYRVSRSSTWMARINANGICHYLGTFATREEAIAAREAAARKLFGEFYRRPLIKRPI